MLVDFYGYATDCTVSGHIDLGSSRLSEFLERNDEIVVQRATLLGLRGEQPSSVARLTLRRDELFAAEARMPAGAAAATSERRIHTVRHLVRLVCGPYEFLGELHALPGAPPMRALLNRRSMVPLTGCVAIFDRGGNSEIRRAPVVVANGALIDVAEPARIEDLEPALAARLTELMGHAG